VIELSLNLALISETYQFYIKTTGNGTNSPSNVYNGPFYLQVTYDCYKDRAYSVKRLPDGTE